MLGMIIVIIDLIIDVVGMIPKASTLVFKQVKSSMIFLLAVNMYIWYVALPTELLGEWSAACSPLVSPVFS